MLKFLKFMGDDLLNIIVQGPYIPKKIIDNKFVEKEFYEFDDFDKIMFSKNGCAFNCLLCSLDVNIYNSVQMATSAHEMWKMLESSYELTSPIEETKISMLVHDYELFEMKSDESIAQMFIRFTNITNDLHACEKSYSNTKIVTKVLKTLTKAYQEEVIPIQEEKNITNVPLEELIKFLISREIMMTKSKNQNGEEEKEMRATCVDTTNDASNEEVQGDNMCFMAINSEVKSLEPNDDFHDDSDYSSDDDSDCDLSYENLLSDFNDLHKNYKKLIFKNNALKKEIISLSKIVEELTKEKETKLSCSNC
ncbi:hypothetical protein TorRG33x02_328160, partial [Trema orientale]